MTWQPIDAAEFLRLTTGAKAESHTDPDTPAVLTVWTTPDGQPLARHQCWLIGPTTRPCVYERWSP